MSKPVNPQLSGIHIDEIHRLLGRDSDTSKIARVVAEEGPELSGNATFAHKDEFLTAAELAGAKDNIGFAAVHQGGGAAVNQLDQLLNGVSPDVIKVAIGANARPSQWNPVTRTTRLQELPWLEVHRLVRDALRQSREPLSALKRFDEMLGGNGQTLTRETVAAACADSHMSAHFGAFLNTVKNTFTRRTQILPEPKSSTVFNANGVEVKADYTPSHYDDRIGGTQWDASYTIKTGVANAYVRVNIRDDHPALPGTVYGPRNAVRNCTLLRADANGEVEIPAYFSPQPQATRHIRNYGRITGTITFDQRSTVVTVLDANLEPRVTIAIADRGAAKD